MLVDGDGWVVLAKIKDKLEADQLEKILRIIKSYVIIFFNHIDSMSCCQGMTNLIPRIN